jgi:hypothetical protein
VPSSRIEHENDPPRGDSLSGQRYTCDKGPVQVRRAYKFRAYPTQPQRGRAVRLLADHCDLYNAAPEERREAWRMRKARISYGTQFAQLKEIRAADRPGHGRHSFTAQQQTLRRLNAVFEAFAVAADPSSVHVVAAARSPAPILIASPSRRGR